MLTSAALLSASFVNAASIDPNDYARLLETARRDGSAGVVVHLAPIPLERLHSDMPKVKQELGQRAAALATELGAAVQEGGRWDGGLGQIGMHVSETGLKLLKNSSNAVSFRADAQWHHRGAHVVGDAKREYLQTRLQRDGVVDVAVVWNVDGLQYDVDASGQTALRLNAAQLIEARTKAEHAFGQLTPSQAPNRTAALVAANAAPQATAVVRVNREGLRKLLDNPDVLTLNPVGFQNTSKRLFDKDALNEATRFGRAEVLITVLDPMPAGGTSQATDKERIRANQRTQEAVLHIAGGGTNVRHYPEFGIVVAKFDHKALRALQQSADARILGVTLNRPVATVSSLTSVNSMNVPQVWSHAITGAGQIIVVMDTGINRDHPMFRTTAGQSRILAEGCYGSTRTWAGVEYQSLCLEANTDGDSPLWTANAASVVPNCSTAVPTRCLHGTHVAGIAAGTNTGVAQGVAPGVSIVPIQVFSYAKNKVNQPFGFEADQVAALSMVFQHTRADAPSGLTVNISSGWGQLETPAACVTNNPSMAQVVANLALRNVPVVAATGNERSRTGINFPACLPSVIKVGSVSNDGQLMTESEFSNRPTLTNFPGEVFYLAPGGRDVNPTTTVISADAGAGYLRRAGTSMAAPHIAGVYALVKSVQPTATNAQIAEYLSNNSPRRVAGIPVVRVPNL